MTVRGRDDVVDGRRVPDEVDELDRGGLALTGGGAALELRDDQRGILVVRRRLRVDEDRPRSDVARWG